MGHVRCLIVAIALLCIAAAATAQSTTEAVATCDGTAFEYLGTIGDTEIGLFFLYLVVLIFLFAGVAVAADIFMGSIEQITSAERKIVVGDEEVTVLVWNKTVANLSLMALGSSAPEIMLAIIEVVGRGFKAGDLGPGTIVGSAAFNMLMIISVCVSIKEPKRVERINVLYITAFFSVFAYIWLYVIVSGSSPGVIDIWEAVVTTLMFPLLLLVAWMADRGWLERKKIAQPIRAASKKIRRSLSKNSRQTRDEQMAMEHLISVGHVAVSAQGTGAWNKKLREAVRSTRNNNPNMSAEEIYVEAFEIVKGHHGAPAPISRVNSNAKLMDIEEENVPMTAIEEANGENGNESVFMTSADELAASNADIHVIDVDVAVDENGTDKPAEETAKPTTADKAMETTAKLQRGVFSLSKIRFSCKKNCGQVEITVTRVNGKAEDVAVNYTTSPGTAIEGVHYNPAQGRLLFPADEANLCERVFTVDILDDGVYGPDKFIGIQLSSPIKLRWKLKDGEIKIKESYKFKSFGDRVAKVSSKFISQLRSDQKADSNWAEQIRVSLRADGGEDDGEDDDGTDYVGLIGHYLTLPFKFVFAVLTPPVNWFHGYLAFIISLVWIGILTMMIGDVATFMGCTVGLKDSVTAITFVALGTSVPDTFASKIAAEEDDNADPAIGNVTGSNAVNVFLGVGLAWLFGAVKAEMDGEKFKVPEGTIAFSVVIFSIFFMAWFAVLTFRRHYGPIGAELGGPQPYKGLTIGFYVLLWFLFILLSSLVDYDHIPGF